MMRPTEGAVETTTAASVLLRRLGPFEAAGLGSARMPALLEALRLVRDEVLDREKQVKGYRELCAGTRRFLMTMRGEPLRNEKHQLLGMIDECAEASCKLDELLLSQAARVFAEMSTASPRGNLSPPPASRSPGAPAVFLDLACRDGSTASAGVGIIFSVEKDATALRVRAAAECQAFSVLGPRGLTVAVASVAERLSERLLRSAATVRQVSGVEGILRDG